MLLALEWLLSLVPERGVFYWLYLANYVVAIGMVAQRDHALAHLAGLDRLDPVAPDPAVPDDLRLRGLRAQAVRRLRGGADPFRPRAAQGACGQDQDPRPARRPRSGRCWPTSRSCRSSTGNEVEMLIDGEATFNSIFAGISRAEKTLLSSSTSSTTTSSGREFADRLIERAKAGVKIYLLYDDVGCFWLPRRLQASGCARPASASTASTTATGSCASSARPASSTATTARSSWSTARRPGSAGSMSATSIWAARKRFGRWRDTHVRIKGPAVLAAELSFREDWQWATGEELTGLPTCRPRSRATSRC